MKKYKIEKRRKTTSRSDELSHIGRRPTNPIAKDLRTPKYRERVVHPKRYDKPPKVTLRNYEDE